MKSKWMVTLNQINGEKTYAVYRLLDTSKPFHSGNRELAGGFVNHEDTAVRLAEKLNRQEGKGTMDLIFENDNGHRYLIITGNDWEALLRDMDNGKYVIARGLDWENRCWMGGSYFGADEFEVAVKAYLEGRENDD